MLPAARDLQRAARSLERLADTLSRELPATLESFRQTGLELGNLTENVTSSVRNASEALGHVNDSVSTVRRQGQRVHGTVRGAIAGLRAAWRVLANRDRDNRYDDDDYYADRHTTHRTDSEAVDDDNRMKTIPVRRDRKLEREPRYQPDAIPEESLDDRFRDDV